MLERDVENLIAEFPDDFFPGHGFVLKGRQQAFAGVGRFDLLFADRHGTNVLMELKAVTAKYANADQLAKYKEALEAKGERNILMWLVAPAIPTSTRELLDRIGIEYSEIHEAQFHRVAERHGVKIAPPPPPAESAQVRRAAPGVREVRSVDATASDGYSLLPSINKERLANLIDAFEAAVRRRIDKSLAIRLREEVLRPEIPFLSRSTVLQLARWCKTNNPLYWDGMAVAKKISEALFGVILDRRRLGT